MKVETPRGFPPGTSKNIFGFSQKPKMSAQFRSVSCLPECVWEGTYLHATMEQICHNE